MMMMMIGTHALQSKLPSFSNTSAGSIDNVKKSMGEKALQSIWAPNPFNKPLHM
jgi:hypothetical protein